MYLPLVISVVSSGGMEQQLSDFLTENLPILNPYLPQKSENLRPHSSKSIKNLRYTYYVQLRRLQVGVGFSL